MPSLVETVLSTIAGGAGAVAGSAVSAPLQAAGGIASLVKGIMDRVSPDPAAAAAAKLEVDKLEQAGHFKDLDVALAASQGQTDINKQEASSSSFFVAGWRPGVGWVGVVGLALAFWPKAMVLTGIWLYQAIYIIDHTTDVTHLVVPAFPDLGVTDLIGLLGSLLGFGVLRTIDKVKGVAPGSYS